MPVQTSFVSGWCSTCVSLAFQVSPSDILLLGLNMGDPPSSFLDLDSASIHVAVCVPRQCLALLCMLSLHVQAKAATG